MPALTVRIMRARQHGIRHRRSESLRNDGETIMKYHIEKNTVQETLVIPLFGRLVCSERFPELFSTMAERFPGAVLAFDACNERGAKMMRRTWLKEAGITDVRSYFSLEDEAALKGTGFSEVKTAHHRTKPWITVLAKK